MRFVILSTNLFIPALLTILLLCDGCCIGGKSLAALLMNFHLQKSINTIYKAGKPATRYW